MSFNYIKKMVTNRIFWDELFTPLASFIIYIPICGILFLLAMVAYWIFLKSFILAVGFVAFCTIVSLLIIAIKEYHYKAGRR